MAAAVVVAAVLPVFQCHFHCSCSSAYIIIIVWIFDLLFMNSNLTGDKKKFTAHKKKNDVQKRNNVL